MRTYAYILSCLLYKIYEQMKDLWANAHAFVRMMRDYTQHTHTHNDEPLNFKDNIYERKCTHTFLYLYTTTIYDKSSVICEKLGLIDAKTFASRCLGLWLEFVKVRTLKKYAVVATWIGNSELFLIYACVLLYITERRIAYTVTVHIYIFENLQTLR